MSVTSVPVGTTGLNLEGLLVGSAIRESVVGADPTDPNGFASVTSTAPIAGTPLYGYNIWIQGGTVSTNTNVTTTVNITSTVGVITSSIPFWVSQSSAPWSVSVTALPTATIQGTSSVNVLGSITVQGTSSVNVLATASTQVVSSVPVWVSQSSAPWAVSATALPAITGAVNISSASATVSTFPVTTSFVFNYPQVSTSGGYTSKSISLLAANLASTVVKAAPGQLYGYYFGNMGASMAYVKLWNASTALVVTSGALPAPLILPIPGSSAANVFNESGITFSTGIYYAITAGSAATDSTSPAASSFIANIFYT